MECNFAKLKVSLGWLKFAQMLFGSVAFVSMFYLALYFRRDVDPYQGVIAISGTVLLHFIVTSCFTINSSLLLLSLLFKGPKTSDFTGIFEILYHLLGFILYLIVGVSLAVPLSDTGVAEVGYSTSGAYTIAVVCVFANCVTYGLNSVLSYALRRNLRISQIVVF